MRIQASSHIGFQNTADRVEWLRSLTPIDDATEFATPDWKERINPRLLRRMSPILRMSSFTALEALAISEQEVEAIIVGTGLGCTDDTLAFLTEMNSNFESVLSPTAFIRSTHNTVAGQIALLMKNQGYNMTMTQGSLSFERSLIDAKAAMLAGEFNSALVGAVDEMSESVSSVLTDLMVAQKTELRLGQGSSFFVIDKESAGVGVRDIATFNNGQSQAYVDSFLEKHGDVDLVLNGSTVEFDQPSIAYKDFCGEYFSAPGFGTFLGANILEADILPGGVTAESCSRILVCSGFGNELGLILLEKR